MAASKYTPPVVERRPFTPRPYQSIAIDYLMSTKRCALWAGMGMGKTVSTATALEAAYNLFGCDYPTLVLAPKRVAANTWPNEAQKWAHLAGLDVVPVVGPEQARLAALRKDRPVFATNYENLPWLVNELGSSWPFRRIVPDEATRLKNFRLQQGGARAAALGKVVHTQVDEVWELTGTPAPNGLKDLWGQMWMLDGGAALGRSFEAFSSRWFRSVPIDAHTTKLEPLPHALQEINQRISHMCLTLDPRDWFDLREPVTTVVEVELSASARKHYETMENEWFADFDDTEVTVFSQAGKSAKCLQLASGAMYLDPERYGKDTFIECDFGKLEALESILNEWNGTPVIVTYWWKSDLARLQKAFPQGQVLTGDRQQENDWNAGKIPLLFVHPQSAGHGLNLQDGGNVMVFFSHWWDMELHDQVVERIGPVRQLQSGHDRAVFIYYLVAMDTVDEIVLQNRAGKQSVQQAVINYAKRKRKAHDITSA